MKNFITIALLVILFIISALFFSQNDALVTINYFSGKVDWRLNWVMVLCLFIGFSLGLISVLGSLMKYKLQLHSATKKLQGYEKEINSLRNIPIKDEY